MSVFGGILGKAVRPRPRRRRRRLNVVAQAFNEMCQSMSRDRSTMDRIGKRENRKKRATTTDTRFTVIDSRRRAPGRDEAQRRAVPLLHSLDPAFKQRKHCLPESTKTMRESVLIPDMLSEESSLSMVAGDFQVLEQDSTRAGSNSAPCVRWDEGLSETRNTGT